MTTATLKEEAHKLVDTLPENAMWKDFMRDIYIHKTIEQGLADIDAGRVHSHEEVMKRFGLA